VWTLRGLDSRAPFGPGLVVPGPVLVVPGPGLVVPGPGLLVPGLGQKVLRLPNQTW
jgi:hypothetical protein